MQKEEAEKIRELIQELRLCHHKAQRRAELIVQAIGEGRTTKGYQRPETLKLHPATWMWENAVTVLGAWLAGNTSGTDKLTVGPHPAWKLLGALEEHNQLKRWQVMQVIAKLKAASRMYPDAHYAGIVERPEQHEDYAGERKATITMVISDTVDGAPGRISLATAIDHLEPCNWNFAANLLLVLRAINGNLKPHAPFAACRRNLRINPIAERMRVVAASLRAFCGRPADGPIDPQVLSQLGGKTPEKVALAALFEAKISAAFGAKA